MEASKDWMWSCSCGAKGRPTERPSTARSDMRAHQKRHPIGHEAQVHRLVAK